MRILVFSDTHGSISNCVKVIDAIQKVDMIIHLGDILRDVDDLNALYPDIPIVYVCGNNDFHRGNVPYDKMVEVEDKKIFITHGHLYRVKYEYDTVFNKAMSVNADIVLFGHTHEGYENHRQGIFMMNPGSISLPYRGRGSYGVIEIDDGKIGTCICTV